MLKDLGMYKLDIIRDKWYKRSQALPEIFYIISIIIFISLFKYFQLY
jgi:hypothetical protein